MICTIGSTGRSLRTILFAGAVALAASGSALAEEFKFHAIDEIPEGEGAFTDKSGEFTIFQWSRDKKKTTSAKDAPADQQAQPLQAITSSNGITEAPTPE